MTSVTIRSPRTYLYGTGEGLEENGMVEVRFWRQDDLPFLRWFASVNAWQVLPPDDRRHTTIDTVAQAAQANLFTMLSLPGGTALVAVADGRPVGYMLIGVNPDEQKGQASGYMADIYIEPQFRGAGIAGRFHAMGEQYLTGLGIRKATLWTHAHNQVAQKSAQRHGYKFKDAIMAKILRA